MSVQTVRAQPDHRYDVDPITGRKHGREAPNDHMLLSVLAFLFCMIWPTTFCAVLSIVYSFQVRAYLILCCQLLNTSVQ